MNYIKQIIFSVIMVSLIFNCSTTGDSIEKPMNIEKNPNANHLAILPTEKNSSFSNEQLNLIRDYFEEEFSNYPEYKLVNRKDLDKAIEEMAFAKSGMVDVSRGNPEIGRLIGAAILIASSINQIDGGVFIITCKITKVETGEVQRTAVGRSSSFLKSDGAVKGCSRRLTGRMK